MAGAGGFPYHSHTLLPAGGATAGNRNFRERSPSQHASMGSRLNTHIRVDSGQFDLRRQEKQEKRGSSRLQAAGGEAEVLRLCEEGASERAVEVLMCMDEPPSQAVCWSLLKACSSQRALTQARLVYEHMLPHGLVSTSSLGEYLVFTLVKCGGLDDAMQVFHMLPHRTAFSWTAVISGYTDCGKGHEALRLYRSMCDEGVEPSKYTFVSLLKACGSIPSLEDGIALHADAQLKGFDVDVFVGSTLVSLYGKCGSIVEAETVFCGLPQRNTISWNAMLSAYVDGGEGERALHLYRQMHVEGMSSNTQTFMIALQACCMLTEMEEALAVKGQSTKDVIEDIGVALHADAQKKAFYSDVILGNALLSMYGKCRSIMNAENVFDGLTQKDVVSWTAMLSAYVEQGEAEKALHLYRQMQKEGVSPNEWTFVASLQACCRYTEKEETLVVDGLPMKVQSLRIGHALHADAWTKGFVSHAFVHNTLVSLYGKCGSILEAESLFNGLSQCDVVAWTALLSAYVEHRDAKKALQLLRQMQEEGVSPNEHTFVIALQACCMLLEEDEAAVVERESIEVMSLKIGEALHVDAHNNGFESNVFVGNALVSMYGKRGSIMEAEKVFVGLSKPNVVSWNAMLSAYVEQDEAQKALQLYRQMQEKGVSPNERTFVIILHVCCMLVEKEEEIVAEGQSIKAIILEIGRTLHGEARRKGLDSHVYVGSTLVSMYGKCDSLLEAESAFIRLLQHDVVSCNAMLSACIEHGEAKRAFQLYRLMLEKGLSPEEGTFVLAFQACCTLAEKEEATIVGEQTIKVVSLEIGQALYLDAWRKGFDSSAVVGNKVVSMYGKCGNIMEAEAVFAGLHQRDLVSWTVMLSVYVEQGEGEKALKLYKQMLEEGTGVDERICAVALQACCILAEKEEAALIEGQLTKVVSLEISQALHADIFREGLELDVFVGSILVSSYGKCGRIRDAETVFCGLSLRNVTIWNVMLSVYIDQGHGEKALQLYRQMQEENVIFMDTTLVYVLQACSETGSLEVCRQIHFTIVSAGCDADLLLETALIHSYGSCAGIVDAQAVFDSLPQSDVVSWSALVAGYAREGNTVASLEKFEQMQVAGLKPNGITFVSMLSACSHTGLVDKGFNYFETMSRDHGITPEMEHYVSMIDLHGRAGNVLKIRTDNILRMTMHPDATVWLSLLSACQKHGNLELGKQVFDHAVQLHPTQAAAWVLMSNIHSETGQHRYTNEV